MNEHYLIVDISNIAHMCRHTNTNEDDIEIISSLTLNVIFNMLKKYYNKLKPTHMILAFDKPNWRKDYTKSSKCVSGKIYKADRNQNLTKSETTKLEKFKEMLDEFEKLIHDHTGIIGMSADKCEADDLIAGFCQLYGSDCKITILSSDKDYVQLLVNDNIKLMNPLQEKYRTLEEYNNDVKWHLFFKAIRANEDNIQSAFPRVRKTRLEKAYNDEFEMVNLMQTSWSDQNGKKYIVEDLYKENVHLMDLTKQPDYVRKIMYDTIDDAINNKTQKYSNFHFIRFCGKYNLENILKYQDQFLPMLKSSKNKLDNKDDDSLLITF